VGVQIIKSGLCFASQPIRIQHSIRIMSKSYAKTAKRLGLILFHFGTFSNNSKNVILTIDLGFCVTAEVNVLDVDGLMWFPEPALHLATAVVEPLLCGHGGLRK